MLTRKSSALIKEMIALLLMGRGKFKLNGKWAIL
jgi:hypothetical protein